MRTSKRVVTAFVAAFLIAALPLAADWPQWRGPARDGRAIATGLLASWPEGGPPLAWQVEGLGGGYSSVAVAGGRIFTLGDFDGGQHLLALAEEGGELLWKLRLGPRHEGDFPGPRSTPTVSGERVYAMSTEGDVVAAEAATGKELWRRSLPGDFDGYLMKAMGSYDWRFSESPLVDGDKVIVTPGHVEAMLVALDKADGKEIWRTAAGRIGPLGSDGAGYSSVVVSEATGRRQYVQLVGRGLIGVDAGTGEKLWSYNRVANDIANIPTPLVWGDYVFASTGYGTGASLLELGPGEEEGKLAAQEVYFLEPNTFQNHHGGMILDGDTVYTGSGHNKGFPVAIAWATGAVRWGPIRNEGENSAAVSYADGRLYFRYQDGRVILVEASPEGYREHGSFLIPDVERESWSHPVIANGKLFLREQDRLLVYDVAAPASGPERAEPASPAR